MSQDSKNYKRGYKDATIDFVFAIFGQFLFSPIFIGFFVVALWLLETIAPNYAARLAQHPDELVQVILVLALFAAGVAIWKFRHVKPTRPFKTIDREREAEEFYGFRQPNDKE